MSELKHKGFDDNTLVVFTSDNGGERFSNNWPFVGQKMDLLEGGIRVPLIARWPSGIAAGQVNHDTASLTMDWTATMLAVAGAAPHPDYPLDGVDLRASFNDPTWQRPGDLFWRMKARGQRALVRGRWKYFRSDDVDFLFDIDKDPRERANLAARDPERLAELQAAWASLDATLPPIPDDARTFKLFTHKDMPVPTA
jgi:arylsulfatase A-like enzyme